MVTKQAVREDGLNQLAALSVAERTSYMQQMVKAVTMLPAWHTATVVALTMSQGDELSTELLIQTALLQHKTVVLPRVLPHKQMVFVTIDQTTQYARHKFGMLEPVDGRIVAPDEIDFVLVPGVVFTIDGQRVGFGGGYYDRWLPHVVAPKVAVSISTNVYSKAVWPIEATDQGVDQVILLDKE